MEEIEILKKEINRLHIEKAAIFGLMDAIIEDLPRPLRRVYWRNQIARMPLIKPIGWCDELPYDAR